MRVGGEVVLVFFFWRFFFLWSSFGGPANLTLLSSQRVGGGFDRLQSFEWPSVESKIVSRCVLFVSLFLGKSEREASKGRLLSCLSARLPWAEMAVARATCLVGISWFPLFFFFFL